MKYKLTKLKRFLNLIDFFLFFFISSIKSLNDIFTLKNILKNIFTIFNFSL